jgi:hypothetical protein
MLAERVTFGLFRVVENMELIEKSRRSILRNLGIRAQLERNWNIAFSSPLRIRHPIAYATWADR